MSNFRRFSLSLKRNGLTHSQRSQKEKENTPKKENIITLSPVTPLKYNIITISPVTPNNENITKGLVIPNKENRISNSPVTPNKEDIITISPVTPQKKNRITKSPITQNRITKSSNRQNRITKSPVTQNRSTKGPVTQNRSTKGPFTQNRIPESPVTQNRSTTKGPVTQNRSTRNSAIQNRYTKSPDTQNRSTTKGPVRQNRITESPVTQNRSIKVPVTQNRNTKDPSTQNRITKSAVTQNRITKSSIKNINLNSQDTQIDSSLAVFNSETQKELNFEDLFPVDGNATTITLSSTSIEDENIIPPNKEVLKEEDINISKSPPQKINLKIENSISCDFSLDDLELQKDAISLSSEIFCPLNSQQTNYNKSLISVSSATELTDGHSESTIIYNIERPLISVSFGVNNCKTVEVASKNSAINRLKISHSDKDTTIDCDLLESQISTDSQELDENMNETPWNKTSQKRSSVVVNLEIKKQKLSHADTTENSKVLILNTNAIENISHVIVQPPNYKFVKRDIFKSNKSKLRTVKKTGVCNGNVSVGSVKLKQTAIDNFFRKNTDVSLDVVNEIGCERRSYDEVEMNKNLGVIDAVKCDRVGRNIRAVRKESNKSAKLPSKRDSHTPSPKREIKTSNSEAQSPRLRNESASSHSRKNVDSLHFSLHTKSVKSKAPLSPRNIPQHKIVAGTHFAVDAFSYGEIPNVKHYFLTHFHSDHYAGLKKSFNKLLFCSKITADLCISRLGVNPKCIHIINVDETVRVDSVEVTAVDANHCPGALMLVFTLPNGKTLLHTGDFRACPLMESYPVFWNKDIHTIYLDTTYCNPRYDFPTQDQSLEMALYILRQKKMSLEKVGKKFSSVLIVCGTYTIGKEKFFLGISRRVGCSVWACPEKERVLQTVEGRAGSREPPHACQLHVVPMRDLTHEKLRSYLDSLQGAFTEVVAFKPSGWENGKNSSVEKDMVTIHGIPYSEHSSFSELVRFVKFLKPKQVVPTVDISCGIKAVQKYFPCPLVYKEESQTQSKVTDYFMVHNRQQVPAVT